MRDPREQHRGDDQSTHGIAKPPLPPERGVKTPRSCPAQTEAEDAERGADHCRHSRRQRRESEDVLGPLERRTKLSEMSKKIGTGQRLERIPRRDCRRHRQADTRGRIDEECS